MNSQSSADLLFSMLEIDLDRRPMVDDFVADMPQRIAEMIECCEQGDWLAVRRLAKQLKGSARGSGFGQLSGCAAKVEAAIKGGQPEDYIRETTDDLVDLCRRVRSGSRESGA